MKKIVFLLIFLNFMTAFGAVNRDIEVANSLAQAGIIDNHANNPALYQIKSTILRQEMVGMALRMLKIPLSNGYYCRNYFSDVRYNKINNWVCRAMETAADYGIISNKNGTVRPLDPLTRAEALAIVLKSGGINYQRNVSRIGYETYLDQWQVDAINAGVLNKIIQTNQGFSANAKATRMDVFGMLYNLLLAQKNTPERGLQVTLDAAPEKENTNTTLPVLESAPDNSVAAGFIVTIPPKPLIGSPTNVTITAIDSTGKTVTDYTGTIYLDLTNQSTSDLISPLDDHGYTFTPADKGSHTFEQAFFFKKSGNYTFDIFDLEVDDGVSQTVSVTVQ